MNETRINRTWMTGAITMVVLGAALMGVGIAQKGFGVDFWQSYTFGWFFWLCVTFGMTGLILLHHTVRGAWGAPLLRVWEAGGGWSSLILLGALFAPLAFIAGPEIWKWMQPAIAQNDPFVYKKAAYLNPTFWMVRYVLYFLALALVVYTLTKWLKSEEKTRDEKWSKLRNILAPPSLVLYVLVINFSMTDWGMSMNPHWFSTIYGVWMMIGMALAGLSFSVVVLGTQADKLPYRNVVSPDLTKDIGHLLLAFCMVWAYFSLSQYLIIWSGNLPEFTVFYKDRQSLGFNAIGASTIIGCFFIPFLLLLAPTLKRNYKAFAMIGGWIFVMRLPDLYYILMPWIRPGATAMPQLNDLGAVLLVGGLWLALFCRNLGSAPLITEAFPYKSAPAPASEEMTHASA